jgi:hypothetical protein
MAKLQKVSDDAYDIIDKGDENFHHIILKDGSPYPDVVFQFGAVKLLEEEYQLRVKFEYEVFDNPSFFDTNSEKFREYIGNILVTNLEELLIYNKHQKGSNSGD